MELTDKNVDNEKARDSRDGDDLLKGPPSSVRSSLSNSPLKKIFEGKDALSYANILRSRNKFVDALVVYDSVLEKDCKNVEAHIGKGICLQMQNLGRLAYESFAEAIRLEPENSCALTHCGILYKDEGRLVEAAEMYHKALKVDPSYKLAAECLEIVLTNLGTSLKLAASLLQPWCHMFGNDAIRHNT